MGAFTKVLLLGILVDSLTGFSPLTSRCRLRKHEIGGIFSPPDRLAKRPSAAMHFTTTKSGLNGPRVRVTSTELGLFSRFARPSPSMPRVSIAFLCISVIISFMLGRKSARNTHRRPQRNLLSVPQQRQLDSLPPSNQTNSLMHLQDDLFYKPPVPLGGHGTEMSKMSTSSANTPVWINFAFNRVWALFQTNTKRLIADTIQPILDDLEHPPFVKSIRLVKFNPGRQSPLLHTIRRLPSRALAEVQYAAHGIFASTSSTEFAIHCQCWGDLVNITVPVTVTNLDIDADIWIRTRLAPYEPFITAIDVGFRSVPLVKFDLESAGIPITSIPAVRAWLVKLLTRDIPEKFVVPNVVTLDLLQDTASFALPVPPHGRDPESMTNIELRQYFPEQSALFDAMDLDSNGSLSVNEIYKGLVDWGYTANDAIDTFQTMDRNGDNRISLAEFCQVWPELSASFVPDRYRGEMVCFVRRAELDASMFWLSDPRVTVSLGKEQQQFRASKWDSQTTMTGGPGRPVFLQAFEFKCTNVDTEVLQIALQERWGRRTIGTASIPLNNLSQRPNQSLMVPLTNGHRVWLELSYAEYVQGPVTHPSPSSQELSAATVRKKRRNGQSHLANRDVVGKTSLSKQKGSRRRYDTVEDLPWQ